MAMLLLSCWVYTHTQKRYARWQFVSHPKVYNGSEYLNICRVTDITRSVSNIHQIV